MRIFMVVEIRDGQQTLRSMLAESLKLWATDKPQVEYYVKHANVGEYTIIDGHVVFRSR